MADTAVAITAGAGTNIDTRTEATNSNHRQVIVVGDPSVNAGVAPVDVTTGLVVNISPGVDKGSGTGGSLTQRVIVDSSQLSALGQAAMAASAPVVIASNQTTFPVTAAGDVAHDGVDSGNPVKVGAKATNVEPTAVSASGDRANLISDLVGKLIVLPYANPENFVSGAITTAMTSTTTTSLIAAPAAGLRNYITQITVSNSHATVGTDIIIQDGSGGTTLYTIPAAAVYGGAVLTFPTPLRQPTTATAIFCANVTTGASTKVSASGYKGV